MEQERYDLFYLACGVNIISKRTVLVDITFICYFNR